MNKRNLKILVVFIVCAWATSVMDQVIGLSYKEIGLALSVVHKMAYVACGVVLATMDRVARV